jgi:hypothetical protein
VLILVNRNSAQNDWKPMAEGLTESVLRTGYRMW